MDIRSVWLRLPRATREWLIAHNGEALPPTVLAELVEANGGSPESSWWARDDAGRPCFPDEAIDWIETVANGETAA